MPPLGDSNYQRLVLGTQLTKSVVRSTEHLIVHDAGTHVPGDELSPFPSDHTIDDSGIASASLTAPAGRGEREFVRPIGDGEQASRTRKDIE